MPLLVVAFFSRPWTCCPSATLRQVYIEERGHEMMDDDTTILVIEINPSGIKHAAPAGTGCGCVVA